MEKAATKKKQKPKASKKKQYERFVEAARKHECDGDQERFEHIFSKIVPPKRKINQG